jgi:LAGLIDADG DNA endonuclease family protein
MTFDPNREELAWAAGFFDGEGCFSWTTTQAWGCAVINQTNRESLERFQRAVGAVGKIYGPYTQRQKDRWSRKPQWAFRAHRREHVQAIAAMLWFRLGPIKRDQARNVLRHYKNACHRGHPKLHDLPGCPRCVAGAWAEKRRAKAGARGQTTLALSS